MEDILIMQYYSHKYIREGEDQSITRFAERKPRFSPERSQTVASHLIVIRRGIKVLCFLTEAILFMMPFRRGTQVGHNNAIGLPKASLSTEEEGVTQGFKRIVLVVKALGFATKAVGKKLK